MMPANHDVQVQGMQFTIDIVCRNHDRDEGPADSRQQQKGTERQTERVRPCHQTRKSYFQAPHLFKIKFHGFSVSFIFAKRCLNLQFLTAQAKLLKALCLFAAF